MVAHGFSDAGVVIKAILGRIEISRQLFGPIVRVLSQLSSQSNLFGKVGALLRQREVIFGILLKLC